MRRGQLPCTQLFPVFYCSMVISSMQLFLNISYRLKRSSAVLSVVVSKTNVPFWISTVLHGNVVLSNNLIFVIRYFPFFTFYLHAYIITINAIKNSYILGRYPVIKPNCSVFACPYFEYFISKKFFF